MPDFRITIDIKDITVGDAIALAEDIWAQHADAFDAKLDAFKLSHVNGPHAFDVDWVPSDGE